MLLSALFFNIVLPFCLLQGFSPVCLSWHNKILFPEIKSTPALVLTPTPSPALTPTPSPTPTPTVKPTAMPVKAAGLVTAPIPIPVSTPAPVATPKPAPIVTPQPTPAPVVINAGPTDSFLDQINNYRRSQGLSPFQSNSYTCSFAQTRAQEIVNGFNHDGFNNRVNSKTLPYPSYTKVVENLAMSSNPADIVNMWINSPGHAANLRADVPYACVQSLGIYYAFEGWKP